MSVNEDGSLEETQNITQHEFSQEREHAFPALPRLDRVPLEILAEILSYVNSPQDVLSVARCNKHLRATLLNPSNEVIWRRARRHCIVPGIPDPLPGWSESVYAAFIFDAGNCFICGALTKRMFFSFVARIRLCGKQNCYQELIDDHITLGHVTSADPSPGTKLKFLHKRLRYLEVPIGPFHQYCLRKDLIEATEDYDRMVARGESREDYVRLHKADIDRRHHEHEHARMLIKWRDQWRRRYLETKKSNIAFARMLAVELGWNLQALLNTPTYSSLHWSRNACLETVSECDIRPLPKKIDAEIVSHMEKKERKQKAHAQQIRRADIGRHYNRLVEGKKNPVVPILSEFRGLPIINALQDREDLSPFLSDTAHSPSEKPEKTTRILESELKHSELIGGMINSDLKKWTDAALGAFDAILGEPNWKRASTRVLHPAERVTARFICLLCRRSSKYATAQSLDFREACAHQCPGQSKKAAAKWKWRAEQFAPDQKAIDVLSQALSLLRLRAESRETKDEIERMSRRFVCKSCDSLIVMDFQRLAGHCGRHDSMQIAFENPTSERLYEPGSFALYTSRAKNVDEKRFTKTFGCRHCGSDNLATARPSLNSDDHAKRRFTFDGLVSHVKEKHKIFPMGDEDFFRETADGERAESASDVAIVQYRNRLTAAAEG